MTPKLLLAGQRPQTTLIKADTPKEASMGGAWGPNPEPSVQQIPLDKKEKEKKRRKILEMMEKTAVLSGGILPDVGHRLFVRPEEKQYFDHYRDVTSKQMSGVRYLLSERTSVANSGTVVSTRYLGLCYAAGGS